MNKYLKIGLISGGIIAVGYGAYKICKYIKKVYNEELEELKNEQEDNDGNSNDNIVHEKEGGKNVDSSIIKSGREVDDRKTNLNNYRKLIQYMAYDLDDDFNLDSDDDLSKFINELILHEWVFEDIKTASDKNLYLKIKEKRKEYEEIAHISTEEPVSYAELLIYICCFTNNEWAYVFDSIDLLTTIYSNLVKNSGIKDPLELAEYLSGCLNPLLFVEEYEKDSLFGDKIWDFDSQMWWVIHDFENYLINYVGKTKEEIDYLVGFSDENN